MIASKERTKIDPKDAKILALPTCLSKLEKNKKYMGMASLFLGCNNARQYIWNTQEGNPLMCRNLSLFPYHAGSVVLVLNLATGHVST